MRLSRTLFPIFALVLASVASTFAQPNDSVMQEALKPSTPLQENLRVLTDEIGGRVTGTPAMQKAVQWGVGAFKVAGADAVHTEEVTIPTSWAEGDTEAEEHAAPSQGRRADHPSGAGVLRLEIAVPSASSTAL